MLQVVLLYLIISILFVRLSRTIYFPWIIFYNDALSEITTEITIYNLKVAIFYKPFEAKYKFICNSFSSDYEIEIFGP